MRFKSRIFRICLYLRIKKGHQPGVYVPLRALFLVHISTVPFTFVSEGDRKAYYETSQYTMQKNREGILKLRKENKELRKKLSDSLSVRDYLRLLP